jgi:hypothetical protein
LAGCKPKNDMINNDESAIANPTPAACTGLPQPLHATMHGNLQCYAQHA